MQILAGRADTLPVGALFDMARFRHHVFVERLGWKLQTHGRLELDQFDRRDTVYLIARNRDAEVIGTARLLPTDRPYLLAEVFPQLLPTMPLPCSPRVWELSRFAVLEPSRRSVPHDGGFGSGLAISLLQASMRIAAEAGARSLLSVSPVGIERILRRAHVPFVRMGPPVRIDDDLLFACCMALERETLVGAAAESRAAGAVPSRRTEHRQGVVARVRTARSRPN